MMIRHKKSPAVSAVGDFMRYGNQNLSSLYSAGADASGADMELFVAAIHFALYSLYISFPDCFRLSIRMAYIITKLNAFSTNITFSHFDTSLT